MAFHINTSSRLPLYQQLQVDVAPRALAGVDPAADGAPLTWNVRDWRWDPTSWGPCSEDFWNIFRWRSV